MISYTSYMDLSQKDEVLELIKSIIKKVNNELPKNARIKKFISLYKELHADDEELTRTRKVRRRIIQEKYKDLIDAMYSDSKTYEAKIKIRYEDGREKIIKTKIKIVEVN